MNTCFEKSFKKEVKKIIDKKIKTKIKEVILSVKEAQTIRDIPKLRKMEGYKIDYRIRVGVYRIGVEIEGDMVTFVTFGHRGNFYRSFP